MRHTDGRDSHPAYSGSSCQEGRQVHNSGESRARDQGA
ncbi:hypothetical protein [Thermoproteus uzoniensis]